MKTLLDRISELAGDQRRTTFLAAAEFILNHKIKSLLETGCYRGCNGDGESTVILSLLAEKTDGFLTSIDIDPEHIKKARVHVFEQGAYKRVHFIQADSVKQLGLLTLSYGFVYLDSFDHDPKNPGPCQRHELAEMGAVWSKLDTPCGILLDDNVPETGGKPLLGAAFLKDRGWKPAAEGYQLFFTRE